MKTSGEPTAEIVQIVQEHGAELPPLPPNIGSSQADLSCTILDVKDKTFRQSKKMIAALIASVEATAMMLLLTFASTQTEAVNADVLQLAVLTFGGAFGAVWSAAIGTQGVREAMTARNGKSEA